MVRPGLTGMAQVYGARDISADDKNALDIWYVQHASTLLDIKILMKNATRDAEGRACQQRRCARCSKGFSASPRSDLKTVHQTSDVEQTARAIT